MLIKNLKPVGTVLIFLGILYMYFFLQNGPKIHSSYAVLITSMAIIISGIALICYKPR